MSNKNTTQTPCDITDSAIAQRAYELWQARGCPAGQDDDNWQEAAAQLRTEAAEPQLVGNIDDAEGRGRGVLLRLFDRIRQRAAM